MQPLNSELKRRLLAQQAHLDAANPQRRLTAEVLERYDGLVQLHCELCRNEQPAHDALHWPYQDHQQSEKTAIARLSTEAETTSSPFQKLTEQKPATTQEARRVVEDTLSEVIDHYMPYFHSVHEQWLREQQRAARRIAKRAYRSRLGF
ncbi:hypothetical protein HUU05_29950 [candidate division KSB1 bacterium]|nr:hypothetical protein [candidate division KSB1 bacterium]